MANGEGDTQNQSSVKFQQLYQLSHPHLESHSLFTFHLSEEDWPYLYLP